MIEKIIAELQRAQREHADASLASPQERDSFEYGRVSGIYAGLGLAWQIVRRVVSEDEAADDNL